LNREINVPFWMLFVRLATITDGLCPKLDKAVVEFTVRPVVPCICQMTG
jgi:hypothetical protein